jgi:hypothetical protein
LKDPHPFRILGPEPERSLLTRVLRAATATLSL